MSKAAFDAKLAAIDALRGAVNVPDRDAALAKALGDRNNYIAAKAAQVAGELRALASIPHLLAAFKRFMSDPGKTDPQCWGKIAIVKALALLEYDDPEVFVQGLRHVQMEPVWGGQEDMAGPLRASAALAIAQCRGLGELEALEYLIEVLVDRDKTVRAEAARAIGRIDRRESALVLRQRALTGDSEPEPLAAVYESLVAIEGARAIPFLARFLDDAGDAGQEAALALGATHNPAVLPLLRTALQSCKDPALRSTLFCGIALTRLPEALEFLIGEVESGAAAAMDALATVSLTESQRTRLDEVLSRRE